MNNYHNNKSQFIILAFIKFLLSFSFFYSLDIFADVRNNRFFTSDRVTKMIYTGGNYKSDYNSKEYIINFGTRYKSKKLMSEFKFHHKVVEAHTTRVAMRKTEELYHIELSNKFIITNSRNYLNSFNLFRQDKYDLYQSSERLEYENPGYYYEMTSVAGIGRIFAKNIAADINIGWLNSKGGDSSLVINPALYIKTKITKNSILNFKFYRIATEKQKDDYARISLTQKINKNFAITLYHQYNREEYIYRKKTKKINIREVRERSSRSTTLNLKYYL